LMGALFGRDHSANAVVFALGTMLCFELDFGVGPVAVRRGPN